MANGMKRHVSAAVCVAVGLGSIAGGQAPAPNPKTSANPELAKQIAALVSDPAVVRAHWGVMVTTLDGKPIYSLNEGQYFQPASNNKIYTTTAALALLGPERTFVTKAVARGMLEGAGKKLSGDLALVGDGDANLSGRVFPYVIPGSVPKTDAPPPDPLRYLAEMADTVAATGLKVITGDVVGDDTLFPWEPYPVGWAITDTVPGYGAPVSALTVSDNQIEVTVIPAAVAGQPATVTISPGMPYYTIDASVDTLPAKSGGAVQITRPLGSKVLRIRGSIAVDAKPREQDIAIQDPAEYAAMAFKELLEARGITVKGVARAQHDVEERHGATGKQAALPAGLFDGTMAGCADTSTTSPGETVLAMHRSVTLGDDVTATLKASQNLHAELLLHQIAKRLTCDGSAAQGTRVVRGFLEHIGIDGADYIGFDGSGLSEHDLVTPRATAALLHYATTQPWFAAWKAGLPLGGVDGTLANRFSKPPLKGHVYAKTGTLGEGRALGGYLDCASGKTVIFSIMESSHAPSGGADAQILDGIVEAIQAAE
jgi:D-alanyl-D-alanine carboxypeptidase/D-alanyl-D-alanine-endopeptidase (penicillin-binding protein 4)